MSYAAAALVVVALVVAAVAITFLVSEARG
jgi:hypothetical protein